MLKNEVMCSHCCGADRFFSTKTAKKQLKQYRKKGARGPTRRLIYYLDQFSKQDKTLLDIGGGIGMIQWHFLSHMGLSSTDVDASMGYLRIAKTYALEHGWEDKSTFIHGDFAEMAENIAPHHFVTLDKVVCCYPDYEKLLTEATRRSLEILALSFPMGGPAARFISSLSGIYLALRRNPFRSYIHDPQAIRDFIIGKGFELLYKSRSFPWHVHVYRRI